MRKTLPKASVHTPLTTTVCTVITQSCRLPPCPSARSGDLAWASSSDGQRFGIQRSSLLASFYPRFFGYYERAIAIYTHTSDQYSVFGTRVISCSPREALYVLDGLLENNTVLRLREHYTDTHGFTEHIFALSYLLGYSFMPRLRDLADQQLYRLDRDAKHGCLDALFRATVDVELIREQWTNSFASQPHSGIERRRRT